MKLYQLFENMSAFAEQIKDKYNLETFFVYERPDTISLDMIEVPKSNRKQGIGTAVLC
jgi:predicted GNAT family acetyltransferase